MQATGGQVKDRTTTTVDETKADGNQVRERAKAHGSVNGSVNASANGKANADDNNVSNSGSASNHTKVKADNNKVRAKTTTKASNQTSVTPQ